MAAWSLRRLLLLVPLLALPCSSSPSPGCQLSDLRLQSLGDRRDHLSWSASGECRGSIARYRVTLDHLAYLACQKERRDANTNLFVTNTSSLVLSSLHPYSRYAVIVRADSADGGDAALPLRKEVQTFPSAPETRPRESSTPPNPFMSLVKFSWSAPREEECSEQNGELIGYRTELWGLDPWVAGDEPLKVESRPKVPQEAYARDLLPFTTYQLRVFVRNQIPPPLEYDPKLSLKMTARTKPRRPDPPTSIEATPSSSSLHLRWEPNYPPTGEVLHYQVRYGVNGSSVGVPVIWKNSAEVRRDQGCAGEKGDAAKPADLRAPVCHVISDLDPDTGYIVEVKTFNVGVGEGSEFSKAVVVRTVESSGTTSTTSTAAPPHHGHVVHPGGGQPNPGSPPPPASNSALVIVLVLVAIIIVLVVICTALIYNIKMRQLKMRYERQSAHRHAQGQSMALSTTGTNSTYLPSPGTTSYVQSWANQIQEIQSRRLPEPPPEGGDDDFKRAASPAMGAGDGELFEEIMEALDESAPPPPLRGITMQRQESTTDLGGYLKPTFLAEPEPAEAPRPGASDNPPGAAIPVKSYEPSEETAERLLPKEVRQPPRSTISTSPSIVL